MPGGVYAPPTVVATWKPNYINPESRGSGIVVAEIILLVLSYVVVGVRVWTRGYLSRSFGYDDALIMFNLIPLTGFAVCLILAYTKYGFGRHVWDVPLPMLYDGRKLSAALQLAYLGSTTMTKISVLLFYRRLTVGAVSATFRYSIYAAITFVLGYGIAGLIALFLTCRPFNAYWKSMNPNWREANLENYSCDNEAAYIVTTATISMVQDFITCLLPFAVFLRLKITCRQKLALATIFGLGFFLCLCGILRMVSIVNLYFRTYDFTWASWPVWIWTGVEAHMAVVCASVPALHHFFQRALRDPSISSRLKTLARRPRSTAHYTRSSRSQSEPIDSTQRQYEGGSLMERTVGSMALQPLSSVVSDVYPCASGGSVRDSDYNDSLSFPLPNTEKCWLEESSHDNSLDLQIQRGDLDFGSGNRQC